jgi:uncharacterized protein (TIGR00730 family)
MRKKVAIFCGANPGYNQAILEEAQRLCSKLAIKGWDLVYGGGRVGLMGVIADAFLNKGAEVYGVIPDFLMSKELAHPSATEMIVVPSMHDRKKVLIDMADAVLTLPGGFGTMDELFEALTWSQLNLVQKPVVLYNYDGYYTPLIQMMDDMVSKGFLKPNNRNILRVVSDLPHLFLEMDRPTGEPEPKWFDKV